jgi:hypothetical protein
MGTPVTATTDDEPDSGYLRLEQQIDWYDRKSMSAQKWHKWVRLTQVALTATLPLVAQAPECSDKWVVTAISGVVLVLEAVQHLNQWQHNWVGYRSTCEALRHEKYAYLGRVADYAGLNDADAKAVLVEHVESLISTEHAKWVSKISQDAKNKTAAGDDEPD